MFGVENQKFDWTSTVEKKTKNKKSDQNFQLIEIIYPIQFYFWV